MSTESSLDVPDFVMNPENSAMHTHIHCENKDMNNNKDVARALFNTAMKHGCTHGCTHDDMLFFPDEQFTSNLNYPLICKLVKKWLDQLGWAVTIRLNNAWEIRAVDA